MNQLESFVYKKVKNNYIIKNAIRNIYQGFYDLMPNYDSKFCTQPIVLKNCFFGFHDLNPFSQDNKRILSNKLTIPLRMPTSNDILEVGFWNGTDFGKWNKIGETKAWNYHKGCRLQWVDDTHCAYNIAEGNTLKSRITNIDTKESTTINWPIDTVSPNGLYATSFSYERLQQMMPGYGYVYKDEYSFLDEQKPSGTGLFLIDLKNNTRKMLLDLAAIASISHEEDMDDAFHFVTHTEFSQDNRYIAFLHRWYKGVRRKTRLMVIDTNTNEIHVSPTTGMVSHYCWNSKNGIVAYCRVENIDSHVYFFDPTMRNYKRCAYPKLNSDGHHHFINDDEFVVDTYPDKYRHAKIYKVNITTDETSLLADVRSYKKFASPSIYKHWSCDLHPRCSADGKWLSFDSVFTGERSLCVMNIENNKDIQ